MSRNGKPRHGGVSALAVSGWPLRRKVALAVAIPLLVAATLSGLRVQNDLKEAGNSSTSARQVTILGPAVEYLVAAERAMVAAHNGATAQVGPAVTDLKAAAQDLADTRASADLNPDQRYQVDVVLDLSRALRESSPETLSLGTWVAQLRQLQSGVTQLISTIVNAQLDPEPRLELLAQTLGGRFSLAMQQALVATQRTGDTASLELFSELGAEGVAIERLATALGATEPAVATLRTANSERFRTVRTKGTDLGGNGAYKAYDALVDDLLAGIDRQLSTSASDARASALANAGITLAALLAAILLALLVSRLILGPMRRVREGALSVAHEQLPEAVARLRAGQDPGHITPVDVETHEEIGQLARAVDDLHRQAIHLASGEAKLRAQVGNMFTTLSRRNTALVNQQLALIESLEKDEEDPRRLESLFRLDHLAARMRRTSDSLLMLADAPVQSAGQDALSVADAMQAATSGVQDYQRVRVGAISDVRIHGEVAGDVVHLLTELVDNALTYSAPNTHVMLSAALVAGSVRIEIADSGLGIAEDTLASINATLRSGAEVTPDTARRMGLFVVSRLAQRHGLTASLRRNEQGGTTASVLLPPETLEGSAVPVTQHPVGGEAPRPAPVRPADGGLELDDLQTRISQAMGVRSAAAAPAPAPLPQRPAAAPAPEPVVAAWPAPDPVVAAWPAPEPVVAAPPPAPETAPEPARLTVVPPSSQPEVVAPRPLPVRVPEPQPEPEAQPQAQPERLPEPQPAPVPVAVTASAAPRWDQDSDDSDTPIFRAMRSAWLSSGHDAPAWTSSEVEAGWEEAERVASAAPSLNSTGLPQRRPGTSLVPGGVTRSAAAIVRDPEAVRARLTAHAAGVSRGRALAATSEHEHTEEGSA